MAQAQANPLHSPLVSRPPEAYFAHLTQAKSGLNNAVGTITVADFLSHVQILAKQLPSQPYAINLCENRYLFTVAFCAAVVRGQTNLLPPNKANNTLDGLANQYSCYCLHDTAIETKIASVNVQSIPLTATPAPIAVPSIANNQVAAMCFTSGSTGQSKPIIKTWGILHEANLHNARYMLRGLLGPVYQLATVPGQHMWGLETTVLLPLVADIVISDAKPFYPADIIELASALPKPRLLVSTPIHLRALINSNIEVPSISRVLCATAPLSKALADQVESATDADVCEVYGCSEMGSMAIRRTAQSEVWSLFDAFSLTMQNDGYSLAKAKHIAEDVTLGDFLDKIDENHFILRGRTDDTINIGGKRGSLAELNKVLLQCPEVDDGVVFLPESNRVTARLAAMVVFKPGYGSRQLSDYFRQHIDAAFVPRPIIDVATLPRSENGKITRQAILKAYRARLGHSV